MDQVGEGHEPCWNAYFIVKFLAARLIFVLLKSGLSNSTSTYVSRSSRIY